MMMTTCWTCNDCSHWRDERNASRYTLWPGRTLLRADLNARCSYHDGAATT